MEYKLQTNFLMAKLKNESYWCINLAFNMILRQNQSKQNMGQLFITDGGAHTFHAYLLE